MKWTVAILAAILCLSSNAGLSGSEFLKFKMLVNEVESELKSVQGELDYLDSLLGDVYGTIQNLKSLLEKYNPDRWASVKEALEDARVDLVAERERMTEKAASVRKSTQTVLSVCNEIEMLVAAGYRMYADVDAQASQYLGALSSIPFNRIATKRDFIEMFGYYGFIRYNGSGEHITIDFVCGCRGDIPDSVWYNFAEFEQIKAAIAEYAALYASLNNDFIGIQKESIPQ